MTSLPFIMSVTIVTRSKLKLVCTLLCLIKVAGEHGWKSVLGAILHVEFSAWPDARVFVDVGRVFQSPIRLIQD